MNSVWWSVARASGIVAWILMSLSVLWGVLLSTRVLRPADNPVWLRAVHRSLASSALILTALHIVALLLDPYLAAAGFDFASAATPFASPYEPFAVALGTIAVYLLLTVALSSLAIRALPHRVWKGIHYLTYAIVALVSFHAALAGSDAGKPWYVMISTAALVITVIAALTRRLVGTVSASRTVRPSRPDERIRVVVAGRTQLADGVVGLRLMAPGRTLPTWASGAHVTVYLPNGLERQYSLCGDPAIRDSYEIAVALGENPGPGSRWIHERLAIGDSIEIGRPRNNFRLHAASSYLFVAGGIGITPIASMLASVPAGRDWSLVYLGRSRRAMPFADELERRYPGRVTVYARDEHEGRYPIVAQAAAVSAEVYACGPGSLIDELAGAVPSARLHVERFVPIAAGRGKAARPLEVSLVDGRNFRVPANRSILDVLEKAGVQTSGSCRRGVCGSCEMRVIDGRPLHLDSVRDDADKDESAVIYPCVSRALTPTLVLDPDI
ncbi:MAG: ferric reductase-like transmembrane domain-containing protein [Nocardiaceae bacterium]|nr:ferric reductase-like transmembrane domain-containing protein [Nocardiaceae bacterium]